MMKKDKQGSSPLMVGRNEGQLDRSLSRLKDAKAHVQDLYKVYACAGVFLTAIGLYYIGKDMGRGEQPIQEHAPAVSAPLETVTRQERPARQPARFPDYSIAIEDAGKKNGLPVDYLTAIIRAESGFRHFDKGSVLTSSSGHKGIMQLGPEAIRFNNLMEYRRTGDKSLIERGDMGLVGRLESPSFSWSRAKSDPAHNIDNGARYLNNLMGMHKGSESWRKFENAAASYNVGPGAVKKAIERAGTDDFWVYSQYLEALNRKNDAKVQSTVRNFVADVMSWYYATSNFSFPAESKNISSGFGYRKSDGGLHQGIDITPKVRGRNEPVMAAADGLVRKTGRDAAKGNYIELQHGRGEWGLTTSYLHGSRLHVKPGQKVSKGQIIMEMGSTGSVRPYGAIHLHFGVYANRRPVDPISIYNLR
jgi:murein DD-endopeptidase MepM/ murein hydrolase activator NlpD